MWDDLTTSLKATLFERMTSPLGGALVLSWLLWNWKFVAILVFGVGMTMPERLAAVEAGGLLSWGATAAFPLLTGVATFFVWPWLSVKAYTYSSSKEAEQRKVRDGHEDSRRLTLEQSLDLLAHGNESRKTLQEQLDEYKVRSLAAASESKAAAADLQAVESRRRVADVQLGLLTSLLALPTRSAVPDFGRDHEVIASYDEPNLPPVAVQARLVRKRGKPQAPFIAWVGADYFLCNGTQVGGPHSVRADAANPNLALRSLENKVTEFREELAFTPLQAAIDSLGEQTQAKLDAGLIAGFGSAQPATEE